MTWAKVDDQAADHPKLEALSDAAHRLWFRGLCYCAANLTDGEIPRHLAEGWAFAMSRRADAPRLEFPGTATTHPVRRLPAFAWNTLLTELATPLCCKRAGGVVHECWREDAELAGLAPLWELDQADPNSYRVHDYLEYNPAAAEVKRKRRQAADRMRRRRAQERDAPRDDERTHEVRAPRPRPRPRPRSPTRPNGEETRAHPSWAQRERRPPEVTPWDLTAAVVRCLREIREAPVYLDRCGTAAAQVLKLWRALERPGLGWFADRLTLVARAAQMSSARIFARDIRAEGWASGTDRTNHVATICTLKKWDERLTEAEEWATSTGRDGDGVAHCRRRRWTVKGATDWTPLDPPAAIFDQYRELAAQALDGESDIVLSASAAREAGEMTDSEATTEIVRAVLRVREVW